MPSSLWGPGIDSRCSGQGQEMDMHHIPFGICYLAMALSNYLAPNWSHQAEVAGYSTLAAVCFVAAAHTWTHAALTKRRKKAARGDEAAIINSESSGPD